MSGTGWTFLTVSNGVRHRCHGPQVHKADGGSQRSPSEAVGLGGRNATIEEVDDRQEVLVRTTESKHACNVPRHAKIHREGRPPIYAEATTRGSS